MNSSHAVLVAGALGLAAILRAGAYYFGVDALAFSITLMMGAAHLLGAAELLLVSRRTRRLRSELLRLPAAASQQELAQATPLLRSLVYARLDQLRLPVPGPVFAPFVIGLLVMLGLLGTFLGLFETLRGTGQALTASPDIDALRAGLRAPIGGLMRGFGTSAAGVASSAWLGLAAVFVRRDNVWLDAKLHALAAGPLARLSARQRQLVALENLAQHAEQWPSAASALHAAVGALAALGASVERTQRELLERSSAALEQQAAQIRNESRQSLSALTALQKDWQRAHAETAARTEQVLRETAQEFSSALRGKLEQAADAAGAALGPLVERTVAQTTAAVHDHLAEVRAAMAQDAGARSRELESQTHGFQELLRGHARELHEAERLRSTGLSEQWQALAQNTAQAAAAAAEHEATRAGALSQAAAEALAQMRDAARVLEADVERGAAREQEQQARAQAGLLQLEHSATRFAEASAEQAAAVERLVAASADHLQHTEADAQAQLTRALEHMTALTEAQAQRMLGFEAELRAEHQKSAQLMQNSLCEHSEQLRQDLERTALVVADAAALIHAGGAELGALAEAFGASVEQQREGARAWLASLGELERAVSDAGQAAAADVLQQHLLRTHELFDRQLQFQTELLSQLRGSRRDSMTVPRIDAAG